MTSLKRPLSWLWLAAMLLSYCRTMETELRRRNVDVVVSVDGDGDGDVAVGAIIDTVS